MSVKQKPKPRPDWTLYAVLDRRPFPDESWLQRWIRLKEELGLVR
jgi:hypothetical protein